MERQDGNSDPRTKRRVMVLGNCVADRLQFLLSRYPGFSTSFQLVPAPMIHTLEKNGQWQALASEALSCDVIFTQPLFNFGPCNTDNLRAALSQGQGLVLFSAPDFEAYFPDAVVLREKKNLRFQPPYDWDSLIIFSCFVRGIPIFDVEEIYLNHRLFQAEAMHRKIAGSLENYARRERDLDISTQEKVVRGYAGTKLFHSPRHPVDEVLQTLLVDMAAALELAPVEQIPEVEGFGFNQWPVVTRHHKRFRFPEQPWFVLGGRQCSVEDMGMAFYNFYEFHPHVVEANRDRLIDI